MNDTDWTHYASAYDLLLEHNPAYRDMLELSLSATEDWPVPEGGLIADIGAGTGNASVALAQRFPRATILHVEPDEGMRARTQEKAESLGLQNLQIDASFIDKLAIEPRSLDGLVCLHALYTFPDPQLALQKMFTWLKPGAPAVLVDPGRVVDVGEWSRYIAGHNIREIGMLRTLRVFWNGRAVSRQNRRIREMQLDGRYWTHSHDAFAAAIETAGFEICGQELCFRGLSDYVLARRPVGVVLESRLTIDTEPEDAFEAHANREYLPSI